MTAQPNEHVWHKGFFWWVRTQSRCLHAPGISKNAYGPVGIPLIRCALGTGRYPPQGGKSLGEGPLKSKEISRYRDTLGQIQAADNTAGRSATRQLERFRPMVICGICCSPHLTGKCGTRPFFRWFRAQGLSQHAPDIPQNAYGPVGNPLLEAPQAPCDQPKPPKGVIAWGKAP